MIPLWIHRARPSDPARYSWSVPCRTQHAQTQPPSRNPSSCGACRRPQTRNCSLALPSFSRRECQHELSRARSAPSSRGEASRTPGSRSSRRPSTSSSSQGGRSASRIRRNQRVLTGTSSATCMPRASRLARSPSKCRCPASGSVSSSPTASRLSYISGLTARLRVSSVLCVGGRDDSDC